MIKANAWRTLGAWQAVLVLCGCANGAGTREPAHDPGLDASASSELAVLDRKQASYLTTSLHTSRGEQFSEGFARLDIVPNGGHGQITLAMMATREDGTPWQASFAIEESQVLGRELRTHAELATASAMLSRSEHRSSGHLQAERTVGAKLAIAREALPATRPALHGHVVLDDGASAGFRTEYDVRCWVPAGAPGAAQVQQEPGFNARLLTQDIRFESDFCRTFSALR